MSMDLARRQEGSDRIIPMESWGVDVINGDQQIQVGNPASNAPPLYVVAGRFQLHDPASQVCAHHQNIEFA